MKNKTRFREDADKREGKVGHVLPFGASPESIGDEQTLEHPLYVSSLSSNHTTFHCFHVTDRNLGSERLEHCVRITTATDGLKKKKIPNCPFVPCMLS